MAFTSYFVFITVHFIGIECQRNPSLTLIPLSVGSFRPFQRSLTPVPNGRKTELSDIRINYYRDSSKNFTSYKIGNVNSLLSEPSFNLRKPTVVYIHGYIELSSDFSVNVVVDAYIKHGGYNVLLLDWANLAFGDYIGSLLNIGRIGNAGGKAILKLLSKGLNLKDLHLVGHSLGVHLAGTMARYLKTKGYTISRLTGLDAAFPGLYPPISIASPVSTKDAEFVDMIHTDGGWFGAPQSIGHVDFWPNAGTANQPGCLPNTFPYTIENFCSHFRSWQLWAESVNGGNFLARKCDNYDAFLRGKCKGVASMGLAATPELRGNYYLRTAAKEPFALGERGV